MKWKPLQRAEVSGPEPEAVVRATMAEYDLTWEEAHAKLAAYTSTCEYWINDLYQVQVRQHDDQGLMHLNIRRRDGAHDIRDWRHFQRIKNEILGPEAEAVELYPAESRLQDTSNKFHLWGYRSDTWRFPVGFDMSRDVRDAAKGEPPGLRQRPLDPDSPERGNAQVKA
jgi:hypothetical protein